MTVTRDFVVCERCTARKRVDLVTLPWMLRHRHDGTEPTLSARTLRQQKQRYRAGEAERAEP